VASPPVTGTLAALVLVGADEPVTFFGYRGFSSYSFAKDKPKIRISGDKQNAAEALEHLAEALNAPPFSKVSGQEVFSASGRPGLPQGELTPSNICLTVAALQPENAIIVDEGLTTTTGYYALTAGLPQHAFLAIAGGAIGYGMPCSVGAAVASPQRPVINLQADGSGMYTVQALWTQAREALNVTTLICSNQSYNILKIEMTRAGVDSIGPAARSLIDLDHPAINWVRLAEGLGVPAASVNTAEGLAYQFGKALSEPGPHLIEMTVAQRNR
jgi:acetolactate synthase-1/2/3 large subunit